jgi:hypothetical protein
LISDWNKKHNNHSVKLSPLLVKSVAFKECGISNNASSFLQGVASLNENFNLKQHKIILARNSAIELREEENKQITDHQGVH